VYTVTLLNNLNDVDTILVASMSSSCLVGECVSRLAHTHVPAVVLRFGVRASVRASQLIVSLPRLMSCACSHGQLPPVKDVRTYDWKGVAVRTAGGAGLATSKIPHVGSVAVSRCTR
jgi:hypothetical protein